MTVDICTWTIHEVYLIDLMYVLHMYGCPSVRLSVCTYIPYACNQHVRGSCQKDEPHGPIGDGRCLLVWASGTMATPPEELTGLGRSCTHTPVPVTDPGDWRLDIEDWRLDIEDRTLDIGHSHL